MGKGGEVVKGQDFLWSVKDEPHAIRRKEILAKYPEIKNLFGYDPMFKYQASFVIILQLCIAYYFRNSNIYDWKLWIVAYIIGGTCNHNMMMALHELSHNLGFKNPKHNRIFSVICNLPIGIPAAITFKRYHIDHHKYQGYDQIDMDIPSNIEGKIFQHWTTKLFFIIFQMAFYALRPGILHPLKPGMAELLCAVSVLGFDALVYKFWGPMSLVYFLLSTWLGMGPHPVAGHFIAEHYVFPEHRDKEVETYSYYGPLNIFTYNVGYHNEHHDFPYVPGSRLPQVKQIASEYYDPLPYHTSYVYVIFSYIFNPNITAFSRVKRNRKTD